MIYRINVLLSILLLVSLIEESTAGLLDGHPIIGPCDIRIKKVENCPKRISGANGIRFTNVKIYRSEDRPNDFVMSANMVQEFTTDDSMMISVNLAERTNRGSWRSGAHTLSFHQLCTTLRTYSETWWKTIIVALYGHYKQCPLPPFKMRPFYKNVTLQTDKFPLKESFYGEWRCDVIFMDQATHAVKGCFRLTVEVIPKKFV